MDARLRAQVERVLHFVEGGRNPLGLQTLVNEAQQLALLSGQHGRLPNRPARIAPSPPARPRIAFGRKQITNNAYLFALCSARGEADQPPIWPGERPFWSAQAAVGGEAPVLEVGGEGQRERALRLDRAGKIVAEGAVGRVAPLFAGERRGGGEGRVGGSVEAERSAAGGDRGEVEVFAWPLGVGDGDEIDAVGDAVQRGRLGRRIVWGDKDVLRLLVAAQADEAAAVRPSPRRARRRSGRRNRPAARRRRRRRRAGKVRPGSKGSRRAPGRRGDGRARAGSWRSRPYGLAAGSNETAAARRRCIVGSAERKREKNRKSEDEKGRRARRYQVEPLEFEFLGAQSPLASAMIGCADAQATAAEGRGY